MYNYIACYSKTLIIILGNDDDQEEDGFVGVSEIYATLKLKLFLKQELLSCFYLILQLVRSTYILDSIVAFL